MTVDILMEILHPYTDEENEQYIAGYNYAIDSIYAILKKNSGNPPQRNQLHFGTKLLHRKYYEKISSYKEINPDEIVYVLSVTNGEMQNNTWGTRLSTGNGHFKADKPDIKVRISYLNHKFQDWKGMQDILENYIIIDDYLNYG